MEFGVTVHKKQIKLADRKSAKAFAKRVETLPLVEFRRNLVELSNGNITEEAITRFETLRESIPFVAERCSQPMLAAAFIGWEALDNPSNEVLLKKISTEEGAAEYNAVIEPIVIALQKTKTIEASAPSKGAKPIDGGRPINAWSTSVFRYISRIATFATMNR
jgi:hypothetical protein